MSTVTGARFTQIGWQQTVDDMISRSLQGSDEEMAEVVEYRSKHFGMNVNTASQPQLQEALGLTEKEA